MQIKMFNALLIMDPAVTLLIHYVGDRYSGGGSDNTSQRGRKPSWPLFGDLSPMIFVNLFIFYPYN